MSTFKLNLRAVRGRYVDIRTHLVECLAVAVHPRHSDGLLLAMSALDDALVELQKGEMHSDDFNVDGAIIELLGG